MAEGEEEGNVAEQKAKKAAGCAMAVGKFWPPVRVLAMGCSKLMKVTSCLVLTLLGMPGFVVGVLACMGII